jgi:type IX secretion system PorP/SprF family membrane protein
MISWLKTVSISCAFVVMLCLDAKGQEDDYTQYYLNLPAVNAGFTGMDDFLDMKSGVREGWNNFGIKNNNLYLSAYGALNSASRSGRRNNSLRLSNPQVFDDIQNDKKFRRRHGLGGMLTNRTVGPYQSFGANMNYAYHLPISGKLNISLGTRLGYTNQRLDFSGLVVRDDVNDLFYRSLVESGQGNQNIFLVDFGTVLYSKKFFLGLSTSNFVTERLNGDQLFTLGQQSRFRIQTGTVFTLNTELDLAPGVQVIYAEGYDLLWAANLRARYKNLLTLGTAYGSDSRVSLLVGLSSTNLAINYSYDIYTSEINNFNVNTHELVLGLTLFNKYKLRPRFW